MFQTFAPHPALQPFVTALAISESEAGGSYKVLPGTGVVIGFQYRGRVKLVSGNGELDLEKAGVTGLHANARVFASEENTGSVLVYFREGKASALVNTAIHDLSDQSTGLDNFVLRSELLLLEEQLCAAPSPQKKVRLVEKFLISKLKAPKPDPLVDGALAIINQYEGNIRVRDMCLRLNTSASPLEKRFRAQVGVGPKKFASIVRMRSLLQRYDQADGYGDLAYKAGFYDQSHFIKEFQKFTGSVPGEWKEK